MYIWKQWKKPITRVQNLSYHTFTVQKLNKNYDGEISISYTAQVKETEKILRINTLLTDRENIPTLDALSENATIHCYVYETGTRYEVVECGLDGSIRLHLQEYATS